MLHYSQEVITNLGDNKSWDRGQCQWNWVLLRDSLLSKYMGMICSNNSMVRRKISLKSSVMDVGNWVISGVNAQENRQVDPMLMVWLVHSKVLFCQCHHLILLIWCQKNWCWQRVPISYIMLIRIVGYINNHRAWPVTILCADSGVAVDYAAQNLVLSVPTIP